MNNQMDERQKQIQGRIMNVAMVLLISSLIIIAVLDSFHIFSILEYMDLSDLCIGIVTLTLAFISVSLILKDAYFGTFSDHQMHFARIVFTILAIAQDILIVIDLMNHEPVSFVSFTSLPLSNGVAISLWYKFLKKD